MKKVQIIILLLGLLTIGSCNQEIKDTELRYITNSLKKIDVDSSYKWIVILPGLGCHGCIQEGEVFMQKHIGNSDILFVITKIESLKTLQNKINVKLKEYKNVYIDKGDIFSIPTDNAIYPCIIELENRKPSRIEFQSPNNRRAFEKLKSLI